MIVRQADQEHTPEGRKYNATTRQQVSPRGRETKKKKTTLRPLGFLRPEEAQWKKRLLFPLSHSPSPYTTNKLSFERHRYCLSACRQLDIHGGDIMVTSFSSLFMMISQGQMDNDCKRFKKKKKNYHEISKNSQPKSALRSSAFWVWRVRIQQIVVSSTSWHCRRRQAGFSLRKVRRKQARPPATATNRRGILLGRGASSCCEEQRLSLCCCDCFRRERRRLTQWRRQLGWRERDRGLHRGAARTLDRDSAWCSAGLELESDLQHCLPDERQALPHHQQLKRKKRLIEWSSAIIFFGILVGYKSYLCFPPNQPHTKKRGYKNSTALEVFIFVPQVWSNQAGHKILSSACHCFSTSLIRLYRSQQSDSLQIALVWNGKLLSPNS